jgi:serine/threonine protein kinase
MSHRPERPLETHLEDLSAIELARIDAVCLDFEAELRNGQSPSIEQWVSRFEGIHGDVLRRELQLVLAELTGSPEPRLIPFGQPSTHGSAQYSNTIASAAVQLPTVGSEIDRYLIVQEIGRGGMGVVFSAEDTDTRDRVAIKVMTVESAKRPELTERFQREARALAAIRHPNIVELFDVGVFHGLPYAVMEFVDGESLDQVLSRGLTPARQVRQIGAQIADALAQAHESKVIHRDLKPQNVMLKSRLGEGESIRTVKLLDFGLSRAPDLAMAAEETADGMVLGTPGYMSPEQVRGERVTPAADLFSLGCILHEAWYGTRAFDGRTNAARFQATLHHHPQPDPIRQRDDPQLAELIHDCLRKEPDLRPATARQIAQRLRLIESSPGR